MEEEEKQLKVEIGSSENAREYMSQSIDISLGNDEDFVRKQRSYSEGCESENIEIGLNEMKQARYEVKQSVI